VTAGKFFLTTLLALDFAVFVSFLMAAGGSRRWKSIGRAGAWLMFQVASLAVFYLLFLFAHDQFQVKYVFDNSSLSTPLMYKISALWAGQDGTFLLWLFFSTGISVILCYTAGDLENRTLMFMKALELILCALLIHRSPFALVPAGTDISNGTGMNPLLMNLWMVIHPPVMFLGYAAAAAPFALFLAGVSSGDVQSWVKKARGWTIVAWGTLGVGIFLGMYWSYEVLGWGGYWAWDPVENASLFPWIILCGAAHGMILQAYRKRYIFWNAFMVSAAFVMVIYGTFLTRSGILADFSLHSFQGLELYRPLIISLVLTSALAAGMLVRTAMILPPDEAPENKPSLRPLLLSWSIYLFWIFFIFVFIGTNFPMISGLLSETPSPIQAGYYNRTVLIPGIPVAALLFVCPAFFAARGGKPLPRGVLAAGAAAGIAAVAYCISIGVRNPAALVFLFAGAAAIASNGFYFTTNLFSGRKSFASYMSHTGVALMFAGFIFSSLGEQSGRLTLFPGETGATAGTKVRLEELAPHGMGMTAELEIGTREPRRNVSLEYINSSSQRMKINAPVIMRGASKDIYISPIDIVDYGENKPGEGSVVLSKGNSTDAGNGLSLTFEGFDLAKMQQGIVTIVLTAGYEGSKEKILIDFGATADGPVRETIVHESSGITLHPLAIDPRNKMVELAVTAPGEEIEQETPEPMGQSLAAAFQISTKPLIFLVWLGMILLSTGTAAAWRRFKT